MPIPTTEADRFFLAQDDEGHWYTIPCDERDSWETWANLPYGHEDKDDVPDCAQMIDGPHTLTFTDPLEE